MTAPANRWKLGLFVVGGALATLLGLTWVGINELRRDFHVAFAYFDEALTGLEAGSPVKFRGVAVGVVQRIRVGPDKKHLEVEAALYDDSLRDLGLGSDNLDGDSPLPENLRAQVVMSWVTSTAFVQVDYFPDPPAGAQLLPFPVPPGRLTLRTVPSTAKSLEDAGREVLHELPQLAVSVRDLVHLLRDEVAAARLPELSRQVSALTQRLDAVLVDVERQGTVAAATAAMRAVQDAAASLQDERGPVGQTLAELRQAVVAVRAEVTAAKLGETTAGVRDAAAAVQGLGAGAEAQLEPVRRALAALERLAALLERDPGALLHGRGPATSPLREERR